MKRIVCILSLMTLLSAIAVGDIARPGKTPNSVDKPKKSIDTSLSIKLDRNAKSARLVIPKNQVKQLRAALEEMDEDTTASLEPSAGFSRTQTIVSGVFLSLALVFGGMWFVRSGKAGSNTGRSLLVLVAIAGVGGAATLVYANAGPPPENRTITGKMFTPAMHSYGGGWGKITLETSDKVQTPELIVPNPKDDKPNAGE